MLEGSLRLLDRSLDRKKLTRGLPPHLEGTLGRGVIAQLEVGNG